MTKPTPPAAASTTSQDSAPPPAAAAVTSSAAISVQFEGSHMPAWLCGVRLALTRLPAEAGGIALNLAGLGSWLSAMSELHPVLTPAYDNGAGLCIGLSLVIILGVALQAIFTNAHLRAPSRRTSAPLPRADASARVSPDRWRASQAQAVW